MASEKITAFILFNEKEQSVERINNFIAEQGISTYFWRRDIGIGQTWTDVEDRNLEEALVILVFLGDAG